MSLSSTPTTTMLWASWATVDASAPGLEAEAAHEAEPDAPRAVVALDDGDLREVAAGIRHRVVVDDRRLLDQLLRDHLVLDEPDHPRAAAAPRDREVAGRDRLHVHRPLHPLGHVRLRDVVDGAARLEHRFAARRTRGRRARRDRPGSRARSRRGDRGRARLPGSARRGRARPPARRPRRRPSAPSGSGDRSRRCPRGRGRPCRTPCAPGRTPARAAAGPRGSAPSTPRG